MGGIGSGRRSETGIKRSEQARCLERCVLNVDGSEKGGMCGERSLEPPVLDNCPTSESVVPTILFVWCVCANACFLSSDYQCERKAQTHEQNPTDATGKPRLTSC